MPKRQPLNDQSIDDTSPLPIAQGPQDALDAAVVSRGMNWWALWSVVALGFGTLFRLLNLGSYALSPTEGGFAFQGWSVFKGEGAFGLGGVPDISPVVQLAEAFSFFVAGATDVTARLAPAGFGIGILGLILLLRPVTTGATTLGMLFVAGLSPSLVYFSRTIDPPIFVAFFSMLSIVAIARAGGGSTTRLIAWSAVFGFAIAGLIGSGTAGVSAAISIIIAITIASITQRPRTNQGQDAIAAGSRRLLTAPGSLLVAVSVMIISLLLIFTRLFSDIDAIGGILETFAEWGRMVSTRPTTTPVQFFFWAILLYEVLSVVLLLLAVVARPAKRPSGDLPFLNPNVFAIWFGVALVLQSLSSGREPDQFVLVSLPLVLGGGIGLGYILERIERYRLLSTISALVPVAIASLFIGLAAIAYTISQSDASSSGSQTVLARVIFIFLILIVPVSLLLARESSRPDRARRMGWATLLVLVVLLGMYGVRSSSMLAFERSDDGSELLAQETSTRGVIAFVDQVNRLSRDLTVGNASLPDPTARYGLAISVSPEIADPYRWYFREYPDVRVTTASGWGDSDIVIAPDSEGMEEAGYIVQSRAQSNRVPPSYEGMPAGEILSYFWTPSKWDDGIRFVLFRESVALPPDQQIAIGFTSELSNQVNPSLGPFNLTDSPGRGSALGQFDTPVGITSSDDEELIYVVDSLNLRVERFTTDGEFVGVWNGEEDPNLAFAQAFNSGPTGIAFEDDLIYVADTWNHRVVIVDRAGQFVRELGQRGANADLNDGSDPSEQTGLFFGPRDVAVHDGEIYVTDTGNERVQVFAGDGTFLRAFGGYGSEPGQLIEPVGIAIDDDGLVYVADSGNRRLSVFEADGEPAAQVSIPSWQNQTVLTNYLAFGPDGLLYMTSPDAGGVDIYDPGTGTILLSTTGPADNPLERPLGVTVMLDGEVLVTDSGSNEVVRFTPEISEVATEATPIASPVVATPADA